MIELFFVVSISTSNLINFAGAREYPMAEACMVAAKDERREVWHVAIGGNAPYSRRFNCRFVEANKAHWEGEDEPVIAPPAFHINDPYQLRIVPN